MSIRYIKLLNDTNSICNPVRVVCNPDTNSICISHSICNPVRKHSICYLKSKFDYLKPNYGTLELKIKKKNDKGTGIIRIDIIRIEQVSLEQNRSRYHQKEGLGIIRKKDDILDRKKDDIIL